MGSFRRLLLVIVFGLLIAVGGRAQQVVEERPGGVEAASAPAEGAPAEPADAAGAGGDGEAEEDGEAQVYEKPEKVKVGMHLSDIQSVDLKTHSYQMDLYVWFKWRNPELDPASSMEVVNPYEQWALMMTPLYEEPEELEDGELYQVVRIQGSFSKKLPLYNYPFDLQTLAVSIEDARHDMTEVVYVPDGEATVSSDVQLPGYTVHAPSFAIIDQHYETAFGDPRSSSSTRYTRARLEVPLSRPPVAYAIKLLIPVICVILCAALMYLLSPGLVDSRVDVGITSLLTIVALQMTFNDNLPDVGYLMFMDKVHLAAYLYVIAGLAVVVHTVRLSELGQEDQARALHHKALKVLTTVWVIVMVVLVASAASSG